MLALALGAAPAPWQTGRAVRYSPGHMQRVAAIRDIGAQPHMAAYTYATDDDMGRLWIEVEGVNTGRRLRFLVVDLPQPRDKANLIKRGILVEMDYESGAMICGKHWQGAARECPVTIWEAE